MSLQWRDTAQVYGGVSKALHWLMAALFAWQFFGMVLKVTVGRTPLTSFFVSTHRPVGILLLVLVCVRVAWAVYNARRRPPYADDPAGRLARWGHFLIYLLMLLVPALALLRQMGSGNAFAVLGVTVSRATGVEVA